MSNQEQSKNTPVLQINQNTPPKPTIIPKYFFGSSIDLPMPITNEKAPEPTFKDLISNNTSVSKPSFSFGDLLPKQSNEKTTEPTFKGFTTISKPSFSFGDPLPKQSNNNASPSFSFGRNATLEINNNVSSFGCNSNNNKLLNLPTNQRTNIALKNKMDTLAIKLLNNKKRLDKYNNGIKNTEFLLNPKDDFVLDDFYKKILYYNILYKNKVKMITTQIESQQTEYCYYYEQQQDNNKRKIDNDIDTTITKKSKRD